MEQFLQFATAHWQLFLALLVILGAILVFELKTQADSVAISPQTAIDWINRQEAVVVDIRSQEAFAKGHIIHSQSILTNDVVAALTQGKNANKYKNKPILVVCARGIQAEKTAALLKKEGLEKVAILKGGIEGWIAADLPLEKNK